MGALVDLNIRPGVYTDTTDRGAEPYWADGDKVRFRNGLPEQIGGWQAINDHNDVPITLLGKARGIHDWASLDNQSWVAVGTHLKLYLLNSGRVYDITPLRDAGTANMVLATTAGSSLVTVTHGAHGVEAGDYVHFANAPAVGGLTPNGEFVVAEVLDFAQFTFAAAGDATATDAVNQAVDFEYEIHVGLASRSKVFGYGVGGYGLGTYGTPRTESSLFEGLRTWALDNWGEDLMASWVGGPVYWWDRSKGPSTRAALIEASPASNRWMMVSPEDRHLICLGAHTGESPDAMLVRWSDQENFNQFTPSATNTAGDKRLDAGSRIVTAIDTRGEKLIFTDEALYSMRFIGGAAVFGFYPLGRSVTIIGQNAAAQVNGVVFLMGTDDFLVYDGVIRTMACPVRDVVFLNLSADQGAKVYASVNRLFTEIIWLYPSQASTENDRYVLYNYREQVWAYGTIARTAFHDQSAAYSLPYAIDPDGALFLHETGTNANGAQIESFIESHDAEIGAGGQMMHVSRLIPDFQRLTGSVDVSLITRRYPQTDNEVVKGPYNVTQATGKISVRARNRAIALRVASAALDADWRMGTWRAEVQPHGRR